MKNDHSEGFATKLIEDQTAKLPSDSFLWASLAAMGASLTLKLMGRKHLALFIGQWAAPFLLLGIYNKIVKTHGHDQENKPALNDFKKVLNKASEGGKND